MDTLVLPTAIPWDSVKGRDLEECLYWLLDAMGAKDLEWRLGGAGGGAPDRGRDIEASFYQSTPDGELIPQQWWVEAKGRSRTVEPAAVRDAATSALGHDDVDVLVIATNTTFSNPTRDWVREWNQSNKRPLVRLWARDQLERLLSRHPSAVIRCFSGALTIQGKAEVVGSQFWERCHFASEGELEAIWNAQDEVDWSAELLIALTASEFANGNVNRRPWPTVLSDDELSELVIHAVVNTGYFSMRAERAGVDEQYYFRMAAYLILSALDRFEVPYVAGLVRNGWELTSASTVPRKIRDALVQPLLQTLTNEIRDVCVSDCVRVSTQRVLLTEDEAKNYWQRLRARSASTSDDGPKEFLTIEFKEEPCKIGFPVDSEGGCPLLRITDWEEEPTDLEDTLGYIKDVMGARRSDSS